MINKAGHYEFIAREGHPFIVPPALASLGFWWWGWPWLSLLSLVLAVCIALFFRNPERVAPQGEGLVLSPADGTVMEIVENACSDVAKLCPVRRVSIFMSVFNVHVNRWPVSGVVEKIVHVPGRFLDARDPESSICNEHNSIVVSSVHGSFEVVQIAGKVARRIACWVHENDQVTQGHRFGLIRFGSRLDVYVPDGFAVTVNVGMRVRSGETVIARRMS